MRKSLNVIYQYILKPFFFLFDPELVHDLITFIGKTIAVIPGGQKLTRKFLRYDDPILEQTIHGIQFTNPVGLSAGFDKDCNLPSILPDVGFGFMQVGSVTLKPYSGNPKPRLFRLKKSLGIVVYYGLKNIGVDRIIERFKNMKIDNQFPISMSVAKTNSKDTCDTQLGIDDYTECLEKLVANNVGDFYTINISCPNTFGGEPFTTPVRLTKLLKSIAGVKTDKPIFVKMPINMPWLDFKKLIEVCIKYRMTGVIIGNLNKDHKSSTIKDAIPEHIKGGISGKPTEALSNDLIAKTYLEYGSRLTIIGVGGIFSAEDAYEKIKRGASLVQLITGMIFMGPQLIGDINRGLSKLLVADGYTNISQAVGSYYHSSK